MTDPPLLIYDDTVRHLNYRPGARHELGADLYPDQRRTPVDQEDLTADDYLAVTTGKDDPEGRDDDLAQPTQDPRYVPDSVVDADGTPR